MTSPHSSLLAQLCTLVAVDFDSMDPAAAQRHGASTFTDMTSNQAIAYAQATQPENADLVGEAVKYVRALYPNPEEQPEPAVYLREVIDVASVRMAMLVYPHLTGRVLVQISPAFAYDTEQTIAQAKRLVSLFDEHGIQRSRVCIKIPSTPESLLACRALSSPPSGSHETPIHTLATGVFCLAQARAAVQAGCSYVAPYFNDSLELRVHFESGMWKAYEDPVTQHPMSSVIASIIAALKGSGTLVMPARDCPVCGSIITESEVIALVRLRPDHITISASVLDKLAASPAVPDVLLSPFTIESLEDTTTHVDYLAGGGALLRDALEQDPDVSRRVVDALELFGACERRLMEYVRSRKLGVEWDGVTGW
ncbi:hypothetical protein H0H81_011431 [Sphagnurus paluster]|uniref:Aldolase n=1 Tax=Sphagnurus paluster TaxID=117069 RepID=A0A9P7GN40_9AGAR|nr:hypothetical protein H0H81_011431 [Sphagnurus paluster]